MPSLPVPGPDLRASDRSGGHRLAPIPQDERFERIVRTAMRLLGAPVAFVAINEDDAPWLRAAEGLPPHETSHALAFCDPRILADQVLVVPDARMNPLFRSNALVQGAAAIRSCVCVPLGGGPGHRGGTLSAMHTAPSAFGPAEVAALQDLAGLAQAELRLDALTESHRRVMARLGQLERRAQFDSITGCWNVPSFRELLATQIAQAQERGTTLALCSVRVRNFDWLASAVGRERIDHLRQCLAQALRLRLPVQGALASQGGADFCALVPADNAAALQQLLAVLVQPGLALELPGEGSKLALQLGFRPVLLHDVTGPGYATAIWAAALGKLGD